MAYSPRPAVPGPSLLILLVAAGCGEAGPAADTASGWEASVLPRLEASARAISADGAGWRAELRAATLRFEDRTIEVEADGERALTVSWKGWGRGVARAAGPGASGLGACTGAELPDGSCVRRLEHAHDGVTAWYLTVGDGFEQGFDVDASPAGDGPLVFETAHEGALSLDTDGDLAWLTDARGSLWTISDLAAWDADGDALPAWMEVEGDVLRLVVDDEGATYPVTVDPLYTTASTTIAAPSSMGTFGYSVDVAGDVNGDGYDDAVIGAQDASSSGGAVYVYHGSSSGLATTAARTLAGSSGARLGRVVSAAGDTDCDGYDDILVGDGSNNVYVFEGSSSGVSTSASSSWSGVAFAPLGDVDKSGCDDVALGTYSYDGGRGYVIVLYGSTSGLGATKKEDLKGTTASGYFGSSVAGTDFDGDGYSDLVVGAYGSKTVTVYRGSSTYVSSAYKTWTGSGQYGFDVAAAGDVDGDGKGDVIVNDASNASVYVHTATSTTTITGTGDFGLDADGAGDLDLDGYDDIVVTKDGALYQYGGTATGLSGTVETTITGASSVAWGQSVAGGGDFDADGWPDVLVGAAKVSSGSGAAYVYEAYADADGDGVVSTTDCDDDDASVGAAGTVYRDADNDGYGASSSSATACVGSGYVADSTDCDDATASVHPGASETTADGVDQSCDGKETCYADGDDDGYRSTGTVASADADCADAGEALSSESSGDCDDGDSSVHPGATEIAGDEIDQSCDGFEACYADADGDGYRSAVTFISPDADCADVGEAAASVGVDCDDLDESVSPRAAEGAGDGVDQDCDGAELCYADVDADGWRTDETVASADLDCADPGEAAASVDAGDCDDADAAFHPGATEDDCADPNDYDCDGSTIFEDADEDGTAACVDCDDADPEVAAESVFYTDADGDGFGDASQPVSACEVPSGASDRSGDCDEADAAINPGAAEAVADGIDQDCDAHELCFVDADADGIRPDASSTLVSEDADCDDPGEATSDANTNDCDDSDAEIRPFGTDVPGDGIDQDCTGSDKEAEKKGCNVAPGAGASWAVLAGLALVFRRRARNS